MLYLSIFPSTLLTLWAFHLRPFESTQNLVIGVFIAGLLGWLVAKLHYRIRSQSN